MTPFVHSLEKKDYMFKTWNLASRAIRGPKVSVCIIIVEQRWLKPSVMQNWL